MTEETLFREALAKPPVERNAFLDQACAGQPQLRAEIEALLAAHEGASDRENQLAEATPPGTGEFTPEPADGPLRTDSTTDHSPPRAPIIIAGRYTLQEKIGEGGMGEVWSAKQTEPVKRLVAVKLIRVDRGSSKAILSRFAAERQAIALLDHPHVAKLLDAGTTEAGSPYFVMELVKGMPLTRFCDAHRLSIPERLRLFVQICSAVQHAHQKGIIHRDLKPSNILVESIDSKPIPRVIDFGLAKATSGLQLTDNAQATAFGSVMGTPLYMAPEQANFNAIDVDTRADVYTLGVILYELLTGSTPIPRESIAATPFDEVLRLVCEQEPPPPSTRIRNSEAITTVAANRQTEPAKLARLVRGDLDWIVMKGLSKERDRRYETANGFARDVERFLNHEPVTAGPPTMGYRVKKFIRRNRGAVIAASLVLLALLVGMAGTTYGLIRAEREKVVAQQERDKKDVALLAEQKAKVRARDALDEMTSKVIEDWLARQRTLTPDQKRFLEKALAWYQEFAADAGGDPATRAGVANAHWRAGHILQRLGRHDDALESFRRAEELYRAMTDNPDARRFAARSLKEQAHALFALRKPADGERVMVAAIAELKQLCKDCEDNSSLLDALANALTDRAHQLWQLRRDEEAKPIRSEAIKITEQLIKTDPNNLGYQYRLAVLIGNRAVEPGNVRADLDRRKALKTHEELARKMDHPGPPEGAGLIRLNMGWNLLDRGDDEAAAVEFARAEQWLTLLSARYPGDAQIHVKLGQLYLTWVRSLVDLGEREAAADVADKAHRTWDHLVKGNPKLGGLLQGLAAAEIAVGEARLLSGDAIGALRWYDRAIDRLTEIIKATGARRFTHSDLAKAHAGRAKVHDRAGRYDDSLREWDEAIKQEKIENRRIRNFSPDVYLAQRAATLNRAGRSKEADAVIAAMLSKPNVSGKVLFCLASAWAARKQFGAKDAERVLKFLEAARKAGFFSTSSNVRRLRIAPDLALLLEREDFRKFVRELPPVSKSARPDKKQSDAKQRSHSLFGQRG